MNVKELWMQTDTDFSPPPLEWAEKFAALVAAHECEACARICESIAQVSDCTTVSKARKEAAINTAKSCADLIRKQP